MHILAKKLGSLTKLTLATKKTALYKKRQDWKTNLVISHKI